MIVFDDPFCLFRCRVDVIQNANDLALRRLVLKVAFLNLLMYVTYAILCNLQIRSGTLDNVFDRFQSGMVCYLGIATRHI